MNKNQNEHISPSSSDISPNHTYETENADGLDLNCPTAQTLSN